MARIFMASVPLSNVARSSTVVTVYVVADLHFRNG